ncbi:MAG: peptidoglycan DD-metalloendopeptidase family protein [Acetobacter sp.]|nr:peptidoglycan DD-metalloendopeptidase family protein [Acetobacter sp.]
MKRILFFSITVLFYGLSSFENCLCYAKDISESEVKRIEAEAQKKALESKKFQAQAIQLNLELSKLDKTVIELAKKIQNNEEVLSGLETKLMKLQEDLAIKEAVFVKENNSLVQTLASLQNMSLNPSESVILQPLSPVDIIRSAILLRETVPTLNDKSSKLKVDLDSVYEQKKKVEHTVDATKKQKNILEKQQKDMRALLKRKSQLRQDIENKGSESQKLAENLSSKAKDLRELLDEIEKQKELDRKKREEAERLAAQKRNEELKRLNTPKGLDAKTYADAKKQIQSGRFAKAKGALSRPVRGNIVTEYGQMISKGVTSKGITYKTRPSAQVVSPYDGIVSFSGPFKGYGNIIIVEHGDGYLSLLAGLGSIDCELGQMLLAGEPVGTMPDNNNAKLYVEIRKDRHPINPAPWIAG